VGKHVEKIGQEIDDRHQDLVTTPRDKVEVGSLHQKQGLVAWCLDDIGKR
jgi:hypothetical protein